ncbi:hypothetical protein GCM10010160_71950 [Acrocarpospora corrugata]
MARGSPDNASVLLRGAHAALIAVAKTSAALAICSLITWADTRDSVQGGATDRSEESLHTQAKQGLWLSSTR